MIDQRPHDHGCAGHLVGIVALVAHGLLRMRCPALLLRLDGSENEKGPKRPLHTARMWMASATPGGAPGYDYDGKFGNNITHFAARTSQRLRGYSHRSPKVKGKWRLAPFWTLTGFPVLDEGKNTPLSHAPIRSI